MHKAIIILLFLAPGYFPHLQAGNLWPAVPGCISYFCDTLPAGMGDTLPAGIQAEEVDGGVKLSPVLRPLRQIAGAPASFYTYFWEMGDGTFSFEKDPVHWYKDPGVYDVRLYATNNYDDGKAPPTRPRPVKIKNKSSGPHPSWASHFFKGKGNIEMKINRSPRPGEEFVAIAGYRNQLPEAMNGSLVFFYNEKQFAAESFQLTEKRTYNRENSSSLEALFAQLDRLPAGQEVWAARSGPSFDNHVYGHAEETKTMLQLLRSVYANNNVLRFADVQQGEEKFMFMTIHTLPEMIKDTNATVTMSMMLVPDNPELMPELFELEMEIVASHDPNRLQLKQHRINYRFMGKKKELSYKVRFQNTGRGPAKLVSIGIDIPPQLNTQSLVVTATSPACAWCDSAYNNQSCFDTLRTADSLYFIFRNIYLPGLQQEGVSDKDSTKGFVEYTIRFKKRPKKIPFASRAAIVFDKNEPVYTNRSSGKFIKGLSPGIMAGYTFPATAGNSRLTGPLQVGVLLAPFAPSRPYFQAELQAGFGEEERLPGVLAADRRDTSYNGRGYLITGRETATTVKRTVIQAVPLHYRYNLNNWIGIGAGAHVQATLSEKSTFEKKIYLSDPQKPDGVLATASVTERSGTRWLTSWNAAPFADIQAGRVRQGPALGFRYMRPLKGHGTDVFRIYGVFRL